ncbi:putative HAT dimerization domain, ribonuclease H-like superfamily [Helianthus debilis subsp. tardiflorus]
MNRLLSTMMMMNRLLSLLLVMWISLRMQHESTNNQWMFGRSLKHLIFDINNTTSKKSELEMYLDEQRIDLSQNVQVLDFWKAHAYCYPNLCRMARDVLSIPVSIVASEASFSIGGRILDQYRSTLTPQIVESLICSQDWLFGDSGLQTKEKEAMDAIIEDVISQHNGDENAMESED